MSAASLTFEIPRVPLSRNSNRSHVAYGSQAAGSRHAVTMEWRQLGEVHGSQAMRRAGWRRAESGDRFRVHVVMHRVHLVRDRENKFGAVKDLVDALCRYHRRRVPAAGSYRYLPVDGLGLIYDDSEADIDLVVDQVRVGRVAEQRTVVTVERLERSDQP